MILLIPLLALLAGCSATANNYDSRPFFLPEHNVDYHGRKTWLDHLVEVDPGAAKLKIAPEYRNDPPVRIAVLPFVDHNSPQFRVDKINLTHRNERQQEVWAWTYANRLRRSFTGQIAEREFAIVPIPQVDMVLQEHGISNWKKLMQVPPQQFAQWLDADTVVYGEVLHYDAYYAFLVSAWQVGVKVQLVSTRNGHPLFECSDSRYSVNFSPAFDLMDIGINSALSLLQLRDVTLARAEDEVSREIALRLPVSERAMEDLEEAARSGGNITAAVARTDQSVILDSGTGWSLPQRTLVSDAPVDGADRN
jgi:hypothetical protein